MKESFTSLVSGQNQGLATSLIPESGYARGINLSVRNGLVKTRPGWTELTISGLVDGDFHGAKFIRALEANYLAISKGQKVQLIDLDSGAATETLETEFEQQFDKAYFLQAEHVTVIQNNKEQPILRFNRPTYDRDTGEIEENNFSDRKSKEIDSEIPQGSMMEYAHGKVVVVTAPKLFQVGNIFLDNDPDNVILFTDTEYLSGGGSFGLPTNLGNITALKLLSNVGAQSEGPLHIHAERGVIAFQVNAPRYLWSEVDISSLLFWGKGTVSDRSLIANNADLLYRTKNALASINRETFTERNPNGFKVEDISSQAVDDFTADSATNQDLHSAALVDNRLLTTAWPDGSGFKGLISLDLLPAKRLDQAGAMAYDSLWTGLNVLQLEQVEINGVDKMLCIAEVDGDLKFFTLESSAQKDGSTSIKSRLYTRSYYFGSNDVKKLRHVLVSVSEVSTTTDVKVYFKPAGYPLWAELDTHRIVIPEGGYTQPRRLVRFSVDPLAVPFNPVTEARLHVATAFEFCLEWTGNCQIEAFMAEADEVNEEINRAQTEASAIEMVDGQDGTAIDDFDYEVTI